MPLSAALLEDCTEKNTGVYTAIVINFAVNIPKHAINLNTLDIVSIGESRPGETTEKEKHKKQDKKEPKTTEIYVQ